MPDVQMHWHPCKCDLSALDIFGAFVMLHLVNFLLEPNPRCLSNPVSAFVAVSVCICIACVSCAFVRVVGEITKTFIEVAGRAVHEGTRGILGFSYVLLGGILQASEFSASSLVALSLDVKDAAIVIWKLITRENVTSLITLCIVVDVLPEVCDAIKARLLLFRRD